MNSSENLAIIIAGPTAAGKTGAGIALAQWLKTEILSFDSRQIYSELRIGAARPDQSELKAATHHFIASHSLTDSISAADYEEEALALMEQLFKQYNALVLVGGSGLYMRALTEGFDDIPKVPEDIRDNLIKELAESGLERLQTELLNTDPDYYQEVDIKNPQRLVRALEVIRHTGKPYSSFRSGYKKNRPFRVLKIALDLPREELYERINQRVDEMIADGLEEEVMSLKAFWEESPLKTVGYDELVRYFRGETGRIEAIDEIKKNTRRYAKRQLTWFRRDKEINWFHPSDTVGMKELIKAQINKDT